MVTQPSTWDLVKAIQELYGFVASVSPDARTETADEPSLFARLVDYLKDVVLTVRQLVAGEVRTEKICVGSVCVTEDEFRSVFGSGVSPEPSPTPSPEASSSPEPTPEPSVELTPVPTPEVTPDLPVEPTPELAPESPPSE